MVKLCSESMGSRFIDKRVKSSDSIIRLQKLTIDSSEDEKRRVGLTTFIP